jgi:hypothetical protein
MKIKIVKKEKDFKGLVIIPFLENDQPEENSIQFQDKMFDKNLFAGKKDKQFILEDKTAEKIYLLI